MESSKEKQAELPGSTRSVYFAGELFSLKHLGGNALLAQALFEVSSGKYVSVLPQCLEQRGTTDVSIRDQDISELIGADLGVFNFDGDEVDSGTVVEYMIAKFLDIPAVIVRSDFRSSSDGSSPWNLMLSFYPRTRVLVEDGMALFQQSFASLSPVMTDPANMLAASVEAARLATTGLAQRIATALDAVAAEPSVMPEACRDHVFQWMRQLPGSDFAADWSAERIQALLKRKRTITHL